ncbi:T-cell surface glycoprotein CD3 zeta chain isoform X2 [Rhinatrema bivittatum]|uniref:T-cell surface glycoprotein CD3 zeta chain isoform X2 n=1 Tax=Rhinatrema bivittatum TaxID=194408 RepID=UPI0011275935|nr:T-cell surface glycoprotein CD3 zeta chain isoform X2 [Rhinatrema bivittatum]
MKIKWFALSVFLQGNLHITDAQAMGLADPKLCYILDGILFLYAVIITALFFRAKLRSGTEPTAPSDQDDIYNKLNRSQREEYDVLNTSKARDPELGGRRQHKRNHPQDTVYTALQKEKMGEAYSELRVKGEQRRRGKGNDGIYQGLSSATKETYDALQMQPLPPR